MSHDFKICNSNDILAEFETLTLSVRSPTIVKPPKEGESIPVFDEGPIEITWILEDGKASPNVELSEFNDFLICFNANDNTIYTEEDSIKQGGIGSYEIYGCNINSLTPKGWEGTAKGIAFNSTRIEEKKLKKVC